MAQLRIDGGLGLGIGRRRQLGADGAIGVVEPQEATIVPGARTRPRRSPGQRSFGAGEVGQLAHSVISGQLAQRALGLRGGYVGQHPHLVEGDLALAQRPDEAREVPRDLGDVCQRACRRRRDAIALDDPGFRRGRTVLKEVFPPVGLAQLLDNAPIDRVPDPEQTVEVRSSEQVVEFLVGEPSHTAGTER